MDNAGNCNTLARNLPQHIPTFNGDHSRLRCMAHIVNLVAKAFISFFFKKPKSKKVVRPSNEHGVVVDEVSLDGDDIVDEGDAAAFEEAEVDVQCMVDEADQTVVDEGQVVHDEQVVRSIREEVIHLMKSEFAVEMSALEEKTALRIFPAVAGFARRIHDSTTLNTQFLELVSNSKDPKVQSNKRALDRCVPTCWNSDFDCLSAHVHFKSVIQSMTGVSANKLQRYRLTEVQWQLADDINEVLVLFKHLTLLFSQAEVPLVSETLPMFYTLRDTLEAVVKDTPPESDDSDDATPVVICIAARAAILVIDKYLGLIWNCDLYILALVMCPDRKLEWFQDPA
ncbi:hypothetical protein BJ165DRAFT_1348251 [Panaeolus papilionaceus]|nr:hypothetical protein BJ165DRAFT_1348251 [Panaeolus papilionaceus]